jgi:hypothetical protein
MYDPDLSSNLRQPVFRSPGRTLSRPYRRTYVVSYRWTRALIIRQGKTRPLTAVYARIGRARIFCVACGGNLYLVLGLSFTRSLAYFELSLFELLALIASTI